MTGAPNIGLAASTFSFRFTTQNIYRQKGISTQSQKAVMVVRVYVGVYGRL